MAIVFKFMPFGATRLERESTILTVQRLDGALFINTERRRVLGRIQMQPDDGGSLYLEIRIIAGHVEL